LPKNGWWRIAAYRHIAAARFLLRGCAAPGAQAAAKAVLNLLIY